MRFARRTHTEQMNTISTDCNFSSPQITGIDHTDSHYGTAKSDKSEHSDGSHGKSDTIDRSEE